MPEYKLRSCHHPRLAEKRDQGFFIYVGGEEGAIFEVGDDASEYRAKHHIGRAPRGPAEDEGTVGTGEFFAPIGVQSGKRGQHGLVVGVIGRELIEDEDEEAPPKFMTDWKTGVDHLRSRSSNIRKRERCVT